MGLSGVVLVVVLSQGGCTKDTDCKGERVCEAGVCVNPPAASAPPAASTFDGGIALPPPPPPPPPEPAAEGRRPLPTPGPPVTPAAGEYPRVVRRGGATCVESLDEQGKVVASCRPPERQPGARRRSGALRDDAEAHEEVARGGFAFDLSFRGSTLLVGAGSTGGALPAISTTLGFGGVSAGGVGAMGLLTLDVAFVRSGTVVSGLLAPALRLGKHSHVNLAAGLSVISVSTSQGSVTGLAFATQVQGAIQLAGAFSLSLNGTVAFDATGVLVTLGAGLGFSTPSG